MALRSPRRSGPAAFDPAETWARAERVLAQADAGAASQATSR